MHSATKYLAGHNDVLGGVVAGPSTSSRCLRDARGVLGGVLDPHAAFLIARGLKTLGLRVERQNATAHAMALALERHPRSSASSTRRSRATPRTPSPAHRCAASAASSASSSRAGAQAAPRVVDGCRLAKIAASLGGVETLIEQPCIMSYSELSDEELQRIGIDPALIRLSVGVEDSADVLADVLGALATL